MGNDLRDFPNLSMYDFNVQLEAYKVKIGYKEETLKDTDDLDNLYSRVKPELLQ